MNISKHAPRLMTILRRSVEIVIPKQARPINSLARQALAAEMERHTTTAGT